MKIKTDFESLINYVMKYSKRIIFIALIMVEFMIAMEWLNKLFPILPILCAIAINNALKMWAVKVHYQRVICCVLDLIFFFVLTLLTGSGFLLALYVLYLTEFYLSSDKFSVSAVVFAVCVVGYCATYGIYANVMTEEVLTVPKVISECFVNLIILAIHFLVFNFALIAYRRSVEATNALKELDESNKRLRKAYSELEAVTVLEERQRIAKDIHDTAGHSITTVIMQTEAAKLIIDSDPAAAKSRIISANLQAKHALEELRESVHLLSGMSETVTLKGAIEQIIRDSCDGTDIKIRSSVENITVSDEKFRFITNSLKEGISNGIRHGEATAFYFELISSDGKIKFHLSDNGSGASLKNIKEGLGLKGMRDRVAAFKGEMELESFEDEGFEINIVLPA